MITELRLENWKSFECATLFIDPLSILIGTNASGKSNVLDALFFLQEAISGIHLDLILQGSSFKSALRGGVEWVALKPKRNFTLGISVEKDGDITYKYSITCVIINNACRILTESLISKKKGESLTLFSAKQHPAHALVSIVTIPSEQSQKGFVINNDKSILSQLKLLLFSLDDSSQKVILNGIDELIDTMGKILIFSPDPTKMASLHEVKSGLKNKLEPDASNIAGLLTNLPDKDKRKIEDTLTQYLSRLPERDIERFYAEKVDKLGNYAMLYCDERWKNNKSITVDARVMSDGTLHFLAILTALLVIPEGGLLAIDEIDRGLHPSRSNLLLEALQNFGEQRNIDVLATTHNPALLDAMGTSIVPFITLVHRNVTTGNSQLTLLEDIKQLPKLLAQGTIGKLSTQGLLEKSLRTNHE